VPVPKRASSATSSNTITAQQQKQQQQQQQLRQQQQQAAPRASSSAASQQQQPQHNGVNGVKNRGASSQPKAVPHFVVANDDNDNGEEPGSDDDYEVPSLTLKRAHEAEHTRQEEDASANRPALGLPPKVLPYVAPVGGGVGGAGDKNDGDHGDGDESSGDDEDYETPVRRSKSKTGKSSTAAAPSKTDANDVTTARDGGAHPLAKSVSPGAEAVTMHTPETL
jgi:hypothetical protein